MLVTKSRRTAGPSLKLFTGTGQSGQIAKHAIEMSKVYQIWWEESLTRAYRIAGVKGYAGVSQVTQRSFCV